MSEITRNFIKAALVYLGIGVAVGALMAIVPELRGQLRPSHAHINLLGFMSMFIFGVAYHIIPRFHGRMLHSDQLAVVHFWLANIGAVGLAVILAFESSFGTGAVPLLGLFGATWTVAAFIFIYNLWLTMARGIRPGPGA